MIRFETYTPDHFDLVRSYDKEQPNPRSDAYLDWFLNRCPNLTTLLALVDGRCAAIISALHKDYRVRGESKECLEIFNWSTAPAFRGKGVGISLLKRVMDLGKPVLTLGGSSDTRRLLPKMRWSVLTRARVYALPRSRQWLRRKLEPHGRAVSAAGLIAFELGRHFALRTSRPRTPASWEATPLTSFDPSASALYSASSSHELIATVSPRVLDWVTCGLPRPGQYLYFDFRDHGERRAFGIARIYVENGTRVGEIVDTYAAAPDVTTYRRTIGEMVAVLASFDVEAIVSSATCPLVQRALRASNFLGGHYNPLFAFWPEQMGPPPLGPIHIMRGSSDHLFRPGLPA